MQRRMQNGSGDSSTRIVIQALSHLLKNASYTGKDYHQKYVYPLKVHNCIAARNSKERSALCSCEYSKYIGKKDNSFENASIDDKVHEQVSGVDPLPSTVQVSGACSWYLSTPTSGSKLPSKFTANQSSEHPSLPGGSCAHYSMDSATNKDSMENGTFAASEQAGNWDRVERSSVVHSTESVTSEDSVFSEDYTAMTDPTERAGNDTGRQRTPTGGSEDVDSSFSSPGSSTSTLEADGKEDGGDLEVVQCKDKVVGSDVGLPAHIPRNKHPNSKLVLGKPVIEICGDSSPPSSPVLGGEKGDVPDTSDSDGTCTELGTSEADMSSMKNSESSSFYEDREFDFLKTEPVRRSTSLKTYKTPPGTPSRKKGVRFADALGLDLESVRHILNLEEPPIVPKSAMKDLKIGLEEENKLDGVKYLSALFSQPGVDPGFQRRVQEGKVVLENCVVNDTDMAISGSIRVANIAFHKSAIIRYTTNGWISSDDIVASYVQNSNDGPTDRFSFILHVPKYFAVGQRLEFAIMYNTGGQNYWDNNFGKNYAVECYAKAMPVSESDNTWMHFL